MRADFQSDSKWKAIWNGVIAISGRWMPSFQRIFCPRKRGLIIADAYDAEIVRMAPEDKLAPARRKKVIQKFGDGSARRLQRYRDPRLAPLPDDN